MIQGRSEIRKQLRRAMRRAVAARPTLRAERRWRRRWANRQTPASVLRLLVPILFPVVYGVIDDLFPGAAVDKLGAVVAIWATLVTLFRSLQIDLALSDRGALWMAYVLPVEDGMAFDAQMRKVNLSSIWLIWEFAIFGLFACVLLKTGGMALAGVLPYAVAQWAVSLGVSWIISRWVPKKIIGCAVLLIMGAGFVAFIATMIQAGAIIRYLIQFCEWVAPLTPAGWLMWGWREFSGQHWLPGLLPLLLAAVTAPFIRLGSRERRATFRIDPLFADEQSVGTPEAEAGNAEHDAEVEDAIAAVATAKADSAAANSRLMAGQMKAALRQKLSGPEAARMGDPGYRQLLPARWLTARDWVLLEAMQPRRTTWRPLVKVVIYLSAGWWIIDHFFSPTDKLMVARLIMFAMVGLLTLGRVFEEWAGFSPTIVFQSMVPFYVVLPLGYGELGRLYFKAGVARSVALFPLLVVALRVLISPADALLELVVAWAAKAAYVLALAQTVAFIAGISRTTNDTKFNHAAGFVMVSWFVVGALAFAGATVCFFVVTGLMGVVFSGALLAGLSFFTFGLYGFFYRRGYFDLCTVPRK